MVNKNHKQPQLLGDELKMMRQVQQLSLAAVAEPAKISPAYLQKLETGLVKNPSPRVLMRLAEVLQCEYDRLMALAGYVKEGSMKKSGKFSFLEAALRNEELSDDEQRAVIAFISYLKGLRPKN
jgi:transcriptional regulator with XRE-family HTH domain